MKKWAIKILLGAWLLTILMTLSLRWVTPITSSFMLQSRFQAWWQQHKAYRLQYHWADWEDIGPYAALAVVAAEDQKFLQHWGFDFDAMGEAWEAYQDGERLRGASTISQQVAKNLFLWPDQSFIRKGIEAYFTVLIECFWSKRRILEVYLNLAEFGDGIFGVAAASEAFFGKRPSALSAQEAALLAAVLPNPTHWQVSQPSPRVQRRQTWIMRQMRQLGGPAYLRRL